MERFLAFFIERPLIVNLLMVLIIVAGINTVRSIPMQTVHNLEFGIFTISTVRAGTSPEKMELSVTVPLEEEILKVDSVKRVISNSMEGLSIIQVNADPKADTRKLAKIEADLQKAIDRALVRLPRDILEKPELNAVRGSDRSLLSVMVSGTASEQVLRTTARNLQSQLREVRGVASVDREGYRDREVRILVDPQKMSELAVSYSEIENAVRNRNVTETGGSLESFVGQKNIIAIGEFDYPKDVQEVIVRASDDRDYLRLRDIATVVMDFEDWQVRHYLGGQTGILLEVKGGSSVHELKSVAQARDIVESFAATLPPGIRVDVVGDGSKTTRSILGSLLNNAAIGAVLISLILLLFYPWRAMVWVVAGLPIAILLGLTAMQTLGMVFSATAMIAMILILGLLVDDAIVASESIYRHYEQGASPRQAAIEGMRSIWKPVVVGALATSIGMMPMLLIGGNDAKFLWILPATVVLMIIGSLFECFVILPSHLAASLKAGPQQSARARWFQVVERNYLKALNYYLYKPWASLAALLLALAAAGVVLSQSQSYQAYPDVDTDDIFVIAELPAGASIDATYSALAEVERRILSSDMRQYIVHSYITVGKHEVSSFNYLIEGQQKNWGKISIKLRSFNDRQTTAWDIADRLREAVADMSEPFRSLEIRPVSDQPPQGESVELQVILDSDDRESVADEILGYLKHHPHVTRAWSNYHPGKSTIELKLDHQRMADYGIKVADVTKALRIAYDGMLINELQTREELIRYRLQTQDEYRQNLTALRSLNIVTAAGDAIPLRNVADFEISQGRFSIPHYAGLRAETVYAKIDRKQISVDEVNRQLQGFIDSSEFYQRYPGIRFRFGGELEDRQETEQAMLGGLLLVTGSIFFLMVLLFNSLSLPLVTLMVVPISFVTVMVVFVVHDISIGVAAMVGFLGLAGVLVNGALVMIDQIRKRHIARVGDDNTILAEDIIDGAVSRLRPLLVTGMTTVFGLGPAAYGIAGTYPANEALLLVMFWGVAVGTLITLFVLPLLLILDGRIKRFFVKGE